MGYNIDIQTQPYAMKDYAERTGLIDEILKTDIEIA